MSNHENYFPEGDALAQQIKRRHQFGTVARTSFLASTIIAIIALLALLYNILNSTFGYVALENTVEPATLVANYFTNTGREVPNPAPELAAMPKQELIAVLASNIRPQRGRALELEGRFLEDQLVFLSQEQYDNICNRPDPREGCSDPVRERGNVLELINIELVEPRVQETWTFVESLRSGDEIKAYSAEKYPNAHVEFRSWLTSEFVTNPQSSVAEIAGVRTAILGTLGVIFVTMAFSFPVGVGAAIYLEEYADRTSRFNQIIQTNIANLAGVPSIIYGMLGLAIFVRTLGFFTSGDAFGEGAPNGRTILSAGLTLGLLILPIIIINAQEAIRAVPSSLRQASYGLGATKWQTTWNHVLPNALPGILTGAILSMSRAIGETAPLVVVGASTAISVDPTGPFSKFTVLPIQIYEWTARPQAEFQNIAAAAIVVLLVLLLTLNATAILLRNRFSKQLA